MPTITIVEPGLPATNRMVIEDLRQWSARYRAIEDAKKRLAMGATDSRVP